MKNNDDSEMKFFRRSKIISVLFSIITSGLGHVYNGKLTLGIIITILYMILIYVYHSMMVAKTFDGFLFYIIFIFTFYLAVSIHVLILASRRKDYLLKKYNRLLIYCIWPLVFFGSDYIITPHNSLRYFEIQTIGMENTLLVNDMLIADMDYYKENEVKRNDIVLFEDPENSSVVIIKRAIAFGNETITIKRGGVYINGNLLEEKNPNIKKVEHGQYDVIEEILIPVDHIYFLGDYRWQSRDSKLFGPVSKDFVKGKPLYIYFSDTFGRIGKKIE